jgi:hypothetical protein
LGEEIEAKLVNFIDTTAQHIEKLDDKLDLIGEERTRDRENLNERFTTCVRLH